MKNEQCISQEKIELAKKQLQNLQESTTNSLCKKRNAILQLTEHIKKAREVKRTWKEISESLKSAGIIVSPVYLRQVIESAPTKGKAKVKQAASPSPVSSPYPTNESGRNMPKPDRVFNQNNQK